MSHDNLVAEFQAYSTWRNGLMQSIGDFQRWLANQELDDAQTNLRLQQLVDRLRDDKLNVAFVAEFSRGKSELINAVFFGSYGQRILPSSAGRTTMCPTELMYEAGREPSIQLLPIETRKNDTTTSEYKRYPDEWTVVPLQTDSASAMSEAFRQVSQTKRVPLDEAKAFGLYDEEDQDHVLQVQPDGTIDVPCWRHAVINFPHPLLEQGLVILDTPGLNAIGTEPELTLNLLPNAHAVLFILAADTGVTKSDIDVWRNHIGKNMSAQRGRLVVLNKIDGLWDDLKTEAEIAAEIDKQVATTSALLGVKQGHVYPISAQKGLVAKIHHDDNLLRKSGLPALEEALTEQLIPSKQEIVRDNTQTEVEEMASATRSILAARKASVNDQLSELRALRGKNHDVIQHMMDKVAEEKKQFEQGLMRFQALRSVFSQQTNVLFSHLGMDSLKGEIRRIRDLMESSKFSQQMSTAMNKFFKDVSANLSKSADQIAEIQAMMSAMYKKFSEEHGLNQVTPPPFSTLKYHKEISRLEKSFNEHFNTIGTLLTTGKSALTKKFFETVASRVVYVYEVANRDVENWLKAVMAPMETQVREHQLQLRRRLESIKRIHKATDTLEDRIKELEHIESNINEQIRELDKLLTGVYKALSAEPVVEAVPQLAAENDDDLVASA